MTKFVKKNTRLLDFLTNQNNEIRISKQIDNFHAILIMFILSKGHVYLLQNHSSNSLVF